ncbi:MAG: hypothetical protein B7Z15_11815, partial [Rhizobiales bacterium 32-66-8]
AVRSVSAVDPGAALDLQFADGRIGVRATGAGQPPPEPGKPAARPRDKTPGGAQPTLFDP